MSKIKTQIQTFSYKVSDATKEEMIEYFKYKKRDKTPPYAVFQADEEDTVVTLYESGKVVFQGISADIDASMWKERERALTGKYPVEKEKRETKKIEKDEDRCDYYFINSVGSDEVGTGDFFGPIVVTASYVNKKNIPFLESLGVRDSKQITDEKIIKIAPQLIEKIPHIIIILNNKKYNEIYSQDMNMNKIKALLHNKALFTLIKNNNFEYDKIVVDQFVNEKKYFEYLEKCSYRVKNLTMTPRAEDKCLSVGVSSIISRYIFLNEMKKLNKELNTTLPLGSSNLVDEVGVKIVKKYGIDKLKEISKTNFKNYEKIASEL